MKQSERSWGCDQGYAARLQESLGHIAAFYDGCKFGTQGNEGYRKSTDLNKLAGCLRDLLSRGLLKRAETVFWDLGCADGRVNVLLSYFVRASIGVEKDPDILAEFEPRLREIRRLLLTAGLAPPPDNLALFTGDSLDDDLYRRVRAATGVDFSDVDLFYTYITLHDAFADKIARAARKGALYLVYGFNRVLPAYPGLDLVVPDLGSQGMAALYVRRG